MAATGFALAGMRMDVFANESVSGTKSVIKTMTTNFDCPAIDHTINASGTTYYAAFMQAHTLVRNYLESLNPSPNVAGPVPTYINIPDDAMRYATTYNGSLIAPPSVPNQNLAAIIVSEPIIDGDVWVITIRIYHPGGKKDSIVTFFYHSNWTGQNY